MVSKRQKNFFFQIFYGKWILVAGGQMVKSQMVISNGGPRKIFKKLKTFLGRFESLSIVLENFQKFWKFSNENYGYLRLGVNRSLNLV